MKDNVIHRYTGKLGGDQIGLNGHLYTHDRVVTSASGLKKRYWQCSMKKKLKCTAFDHTISSNEFIFCQLEDKSGGKGIFPNGS